MQAFYLSIFSILVLFSGASADIPVHCLFNDYIGEWTYYLGDNGYNNTINCKNSFALKEKYTIYLKDPNVAVDDRGDTGFWTRIYDEGVEVVISNRKFFAFSKYYETGSQVTSVCSETSNGWYHNEDGTNWGCYYAKRISNGLHQRSLTTNFTSSNNKVVDENSVYIQDSIVNRVNSANTSWKAKVYPQFQRKTIKQMHQLSGAGKGRMFEGSKKNRLLLNQQHNQDFPKNFSWRNVNGVNYVSPVRSQGMCGSCYSFATTAMLESRIRIMTNNSDQAILSPQGVVSCSEYSQGCSGGFSYLVGKYAEDFHLVEEDCFPYQGSSSVSCDKQCTDPSKRRRATNYKYIGGYYGACNVDDMMTELVENGPITVDFMVYPDFYTYSEGVYSHQSSIIQSTQPGWEEVNHSVLLVGYGVDSSSGSPYWEVKNSWGEEWGIEGYFKILRGSNECGIESIAFSATPIL